MYGASADTTVAAGLRYGFADVDPRAVLRWSVRAVAVAATAAFTVLVAWHPGGPAHWTAFDDIGQAVTPFVAAGACLWTSRRSAGRERAAWVLIGLGAASWGAGQIAWTVYEVGLGYQPVSPSICDAGFLLSPLLVVGGLLSFVETPAGLLSRVRGAIEASIIGGGLLIAVWTILLAPVASGAKDRMTEQLVTLAYPVLDTVGIAALLFLASRPRSHRFGSLPLLGMGIACLAVADSAFWYLTTVKNYGDVNPTDAGWFAGFLLVAFAAVAGHPTPPHRVQRRHLVVNRSVVGVPEVLGGSGLALAGIYRVATADGRFDEASSWMIVALAFLALANALISVVENHALTTSLEDRVMARTAELAGRERHFSALVQHSSDVIIVVDPDLVIASVSDGIADVYGWDPSRFTGLRLDDFGELFETLTNVLMMGSASSGQVLHVAWELTDFAGRRRFAESDISNLVADPDVGGYVINTHDVTDRTLLEVELRDQALHDDLSGLANRALFNDRAQHALARAQRSGTAVAVLVIDLDGFKDVNDSLGHHAGDVVLRKVAQEITAISRSTDTVARLGGDEFAVLLEDLRDADEALSTAKVLGARIRDTVMVDDANFRVTASVGVALSEGATRSVGELLRDADTAMYVAKNSGKNKACLFEPSMHDRAKERFELVSEFKSAIDRREFALQYQPCWVLDTGALEGFEALLRWNHPSRGLIPPDRFIPFGEESGLIVPLGQWVLEEAIGQLEAWSTSLSDPTSLTMAVNISALQLHDRHLVNYVHRAIGATGIEPRQIVLEVTESALIHDSAEVATVLRNLKSKGVRIAIDDFGTGYSSLAYLRDLPVDILKIDKAFVSPTDPNERNGLLGAIVHLAKTLGLQSVAEGIETQAQAGLLRDLGCEYGQGHLWAASLNIDDAWTLLNTPGRSVNESAPLAW